jgi:hypothetical protein
MPTDNPHVVIEMADKADCRFVADWLIKVDEAEKAWRNAWGDPLFAERIIELTWEGIPSLEARALELLGELQHAHQVAVLDLYPNDDVSLNREFPLLVQLGFFVVTGESYWMTVPGEITVASVKEAALDLMRTKDMGEDGDRDEDERFIQPERLLRTHSAREAQALRSRLMAMRRFEPHVPGEPIQ